MSTRCNILVKLNDEDKNTVLSFRDVNVETNGNYMGIYCHHDGYVEGVGKELLEHYNSYDKAKNLIIPGNCSSVHSSDADYYTDYGETYERNKPKMYNENPGVMQEYLYVFENNEWFVYSNRIKGKTVKEVLEENGD